MRTFAQWIKAQEDRDDQVGYFARYWSQASPGKISSVTGVERKLEEIRLELQGEPPEGQSAPAWERGKVAIEAAFTGYRMAVDEFHADQPDQPEQPKLPGLEPPAPAHPVERGLEGSGASLHITGPTEGAGQPRTEPDSPGQPARARKSRAKPAADDGRLDRIEDALAAIMAQNALILDLLTSLLGPPGEPEPVDWDELAALADFGAVPE
jgi:hypothetical protein